MDLSGGGCSGRNQRGRRERQRADANDVAIHVWTSRDPFFPYLPPRRMPYPCAAWRVDGLSGESVALEDGFLESLKDGVSRTKLPLSDWRGTDLRPVSKRKIPLMGPKQDCLQVIFKFDVWVALIVPEEPAPTCTAQQGAREGARGALIRRAGAPRC